MDVLRRLKDILKKRKTTLLFGRACAASQPKQAEMKEQKTSMSSCGVWRKDERPLEIKVTSQ